jgi:flagellar biosynthetic protein FliR
LGIDLSGLTALAPTLVFGAFSVFCRISAAISLLPGFGERTIPVRVKLAAALGASMALWPLVERHIGAMPEAIPDLALVLLGEIGAGLLFGLWVRLMILALQMAGAIIGQHLSISALFSGPTAPDPETSFATFLSITGITLLLVTGVHLDIFIALAGTYEVLPWGILPNGEDAAASILDRGSLAIKLGFQLSLPFVVASFVYNLCLGAMNRAMPQLLVSLIGAPALVGGGLLLFMLALPLILNVWRRSVETTLAGLG